jgi:hypothetical protein
LYGGAHWQPLLQKYLVALMDHIALCEYCAHWQLLLQKYLVALMDNTALYDSALTGNFLLL